MRPRLRSRARVRTEASYRYGLVFLIVLVLLVFEILTPDTNWSRALGIALAGAALAVAVGTSRAPGQVRRLRARLVATSALIVVIGAGTGILSATVAFVVATILLAALPFALAGGLARLVRKHGVTVQAVLGSLTIYLVTGLLFASLIAFVSHVESRPFFKQTEHPPAGVRVYYSFTVMTTTGFGDYTAAQASGRALAVLEMLLGQIYLVTVIGVAVGNFAGRAFRPGEPEPTDSPTSEAAS